MNETTLVVFAATVAAGMAFLIRAGASASLRAAIRTSVVLLLGWTLAYNNEYSPISWPSLSWRIWLMLGISFLALGLAWGLYLRDSRCPGPSPVAAADRINVFFAAGFALLLILGSAPQRYAYAVLLVSGAVLLAFKRG